MADFYLAITGDDDPEELSANLLMVPVFIDIFTPTFDYFHYETVYGRGGDDELTTTLGTTSVWLEGGDGNDEVTGGGGGDTLHGDNFDTGTEQATGTGNDTIHGGAGEDAIYGAGGNDRIFGEDDGDTIYAGTGKDRVDGGGGEDILLGRGGDDRLTGGLNADHFVFTRKGGRDTITDFDPTGADHDLIILVELNAVENFRDLIQNHAEKRNGDVLLTLGAGTEIVIEDTKIGDLVKADFRFELLA